MTTGLPDVFVGFEPLPAPPVDRPDDPDGPGASRGRRGEHVKVSAATCGHTSVGTGLRGRGRYVVTNAHVVAGATRRRSGSPTPRGKRLDAVAVLFDPDLDVAVLHVDGLGARRSVRRQGPGPRRARRDHRLPGRRRADDPAGGGRRPYPATGRDIYGDETVKREILELRAEVDRGDSGGPLILKDGTVGGVVFAESRTEPGVGYALRRARGRGTVAPALGRHGRGRHRRLRPLTVAPAPPAAVRAPRTVTHAVDLPGRRQETPDARRAPSPPTPPSAIPPP